MLLRQKAKEHPMLAGLDGDLPGVPFVLLVILKGPEERHGYAVVQELPGCWTSILSGKGGLLLVCE